MVLWRGEVCIHDLDTNDVWILLTQGQDHVLDFRLDVQMEQFRAWELEDNI